jgi:hypothetical protein
MVLYDYFVCVCGTVLGWEIYSNLTSRGLEALSSLLGSYATIRYGVGVRTMYPHLSDGLRYRIAHFTFITSDFSHLPSMYQNCNRNNIATSLGRAFQSRSKQTPSRLPVETKPIAPLSSATFVTTTPPLPSLFLETRAILCQYRTSCTQS